MMPTMIALQSKVRMEHPEMIGAMMWTKSKIHRWARESNNKTVMKLAAGYNRLKEALGLENGWGALIEPAKGRRIYYLERIKVVRQKKIDDALPRVIDLGTLTEASPQAISDKLWGQNDVKVIMPDKVMAGFVLPGSTAYREIVERLPNDKEGFDKFVSVYGYESIANAVDAVEKSWPLGLKEEIKAAMKRLEEKTGKWFGKDLFVSVRGAPGFFSPGAMDTILNVGFTLENVKNCVKQGGETAKWALDCYRRLIAMVAISVFELDYDLFNNIVSDLKKERGISDEENLINVQDLQSVVDKSLAIFKKKTEFDFPLKPWDILVLSINAAFRSHYNPEAVAFREEHGLPDDVGPSVGIQEMAFGNFGEDTLTGVAFTRNVGTGRREMVVEWLGGSQGEDVVAGIRRVKSYRDLLAHYPEIARELEEIGRELEKRYGRMQEIEFTVIRNKEGELELKILQRRTDKDLGAAAVRIAVEMVNEGIITKEAAILSVRAEDVNALLFPYIPQEVREEAKRLGKGLAGSPGAFTGVVVMSKEKALELAAENPNIKMIMVRDETSPSDNPGILISQTLGLMTKKGGLTAHAAVVSRGAGKGCVPSVEGLEVFDDLEANKLKGQPDKYFTLGGQKIREGETITIDGHTGEVFLGRVETVRIEELPEHLMTLLKWADEYRQLKVRVNADTEVDTKVAVKYGAEGNGLLRTEHTMFSTELWPVVQELILARTAEERKEPLARLKEAHRKNYRAVYSTMAKDEMIPPITVRLLDPPLHEFAPNQLKVNEIYFRRLLAAAGKKEYMPEVIKEDRELWEMPLEDLKKLAGRVAELHEHNPMLGLRGVRLGILMPDIYRMQVEAQLEVAAELYKEGYEITPEIEIPLVGVPRELDPMLEMIEEVAEEVVKKQALPETWGYKVGTMIELPAAALKAEDLAGTLKYHKDGTPRKRVVGVFHSYGTNDLTQTTLGLSRDDAARIIQYYLQKRIYEKDPFVTIHPVVQQMVRIGVGRARASGGEMEIGVCGEHGGDPDSIMFFHALGMDFVSLSPYRIPAAKLVAAQAALIEQGYHLKSLLLGR